MYGLMTSPFLCAFCTEVCSRSHVGAFLKHSIVLDPFLGKEASSGEPSARTEVLSWTNSSAAPRGSRVSSAPGWGYGVGVGVGVGAELGFGFGLGLG